MKDSSLKIFISHVILYIFISGGFVLILLVSKNLPFPTALSLLFVLLC